MAVRFTEHGASNRHAGRRAACHSIGIYTVRDGRLAGCALEQDYFSRRRQLADGEPITVDAPAIAPWDTPDLPGDEESERAVQRWLQSAAFLTDDRVQIDDSHATGVVQKILTAPVLEMLELFSGRRDGRISRRAARPPRRRFPRRGRGPGRTGGVHAHERVRHRTRRRRPRRPTSSAIASACTAASSRDPDGDPLRNSPGGS